jgi:hypothetical protein
MEDTKMQNAKCLEVYTAEGALICRVYLTEREMPTARQKEPGAEASPGQVKGEARQNGGMMTPPQKRKLFRLIAVKGFEGDQAHRELMKLFQVDSLEDVGKSEASQMIDRLVRETKGGKGNGSSL